MHDCPTSELPSRPECSPNFEGCFCKPSLYHHQGQSWLPPHFYTIGRGACPACLSSFTINSAGKPSPKIPGSSMLRRDRIHKWGPSEGPWLQDRKPSHRFIGYLVLDKYHLGKRPCTPFKQFWNILEHSICALLREASSSCYVRLQSIKMREESWVRGIDQKTAQPAFKSYSRKETS